MPDVISALPSYIIIPVAIAILLFNFYSFVKASKMEKALENKKLRLLRTIQDNFDLFIAFTVFSLYFKPDYAFNTFLSASTIIIYTIFYALIYMPQSFRRKLIRFSCYIDFGKLRKIILILYLFLTFFLYIDFIQYSLYILQSQYQIQASNAFNMISGIYKKDIFVMLSFLLSSLIYFVVVRVLLEPAFKLLSSKKLSTVLIDVFLKDGDPINNVFLIESFGDYYVFYDSSFEAEARNKYVISKDNIKYFNFK